MPRYDTAKAPPEFSPPPRGLGGRTWTTGIVAAAVVILGLFLWTGVGKDRPSSSRSDTAARPASTAAR